MVSPPFHLGRHTLKTYSLTFSYPFMLSQQEKNPYFSRMSPPMSYLLILRYSPSSKDVKTYPYSSIHVPSPSVTQVQTRPLSSPTVLLLPPTDPASRLLPPGELPVPAALQHQLQNLRQLWHPESQRAQQSLWHKLTKDWLHQETSSETDPH